MLVKRTFLGSDGVRYRPGDSAPKDLPEVTGRPWLFTKPKTDKKGR